MRYRKLTNGDYTFGRREQNFVSDIDAVAQAIRTNLLLLQGEWWEDTEKGLPLFQRILGQPGVPDSVRAADLLVQDVMLQTTGVIRIKNLQSSYKNRAYQFACEVDTVYGALSLQEKVIPQEVII
ncbi:hypothetical protein [Paenibacillus ginsengarvi]|uniref:DUF2634 domain-containing protein n=1 Tax=Paenibacillus ginsengarvi TaxID=400777 RepID=A0A3B0BRI4_9BACL|nr:hypothetical protein [Paenibacillus ginsengarvi]RKN74994.1 hypothetical protein D7M11_26005 [Paenibacillus ginsengarvi]